MTPFKSLLILAGIFAIAATGALAFESVYRISVAPRQAEPFVPVQSGSDPAAARSQPAFGLRLVDSGGVGIPLDSDWGTSYSHDRRTFRDVILEDAPYIDENAFARVEMEWRAYVERMLAYGNNAIAVPLFLELTDFDRVRLPDGGRFEIYDANSAFRARHAAVRRHFGPLFEWTDRRGMQVFLDTDMLALTPPLSRVLQRVAPGARGIAASDPAVWATYRAGFEELFDTFPFLKGVVIRFGEGGGLYNTAGWPYQSEPAVRTAADLRAMLRGLLPVFEANGKTLVLRSWTVGVGQLGRLHVDPTVYDRVLGDIDSPALVVSTKFTAGDFFSYLPLNRTLARGRHRRLVELQAKPEFEGFGAFPDFLGHEYARALRELRAANPRIAGTYVLPQFGGPLRAGPRILYPLHGFWLWTDSNVFVASQLALNPDADVDELARQWARARFGDDPKVVAAITRVLADTRDAVLKGFYIRPFAERAVRVPGLELPPLMWIFEWDMVGGWHSLLSVVYHNSRDAVDVSIGEGYAAAATVRRARQQLQTTVETVGAGACVHCDEALRSLEYQQTLFDALAAWRQAFLSYYRWLDTGGAKAWYDWRTGRDAFEIAASRHATRFAHDLDFPAFDLTSALEAVRAADETRRARFLAVALLVGLTPLLVAGSPRARRWRVPAGFSALIRIGRVAWTMALAPWRAGGEAVDLVSSVGVTILVLVLAGVLIDSLTGFATPWVSVASLLPFGAVALAFESTAIGVNSAQERGRLLVACAAPSLPGLIVLFAALAYLGPVGFWYSFWTSPMFRVIVLTTTIATPLWTAYAMLAARASDGWRGALAGLLAASGAGLVTLTLLLPDWINVLRSLNRPLNFAPATDTMLFALRSYAGVSLGIGDSSRALGGALLVVGYAIWLTCPTGSGREKRPLQR